MLSIYDLFGVPCEQYACKSPRPIMPTVFVRQLSFLRGVDEELFWKGEGMEQHCIFLGRDLCVCLVTHMCPFVAPKSIQARETVPSFT